MKMRIPMKFVKPVKNKSNWT